MHVNNAREVPEYEIDPKELDFTNSVDITKVIHCSLLFRMLVSLNLFSFTGLVLKVHCTNSCLLLKLPVTKTFANFIVDSLVNGINIFFALECIFFTYSCFSPYVGDKIQNLDQDWYGSATNICLGMSIMIPVIEFDILLNRETTQPTWR